MQTDPSTQLPEVPQIPEVNQALTMTDSYVDQGTAKLAQVATIIGGDTVKQYGITNDNIKRVMMFIGAYTSLKFLYDRGFKYKWPILGTAAAIYALRTYYAGQPVVMAAATKPTNAVITNSLASQGLLPPPA